MSILAITLAIILILAVNGTLNIVCFFIGAKVGQTVSKGETIEVPTINPIKAYNEHLDRKEHEREQKRFDALLHNVDVYDGTANGQEDIPRW